FTFTREISSPLDLDFAAAFVASCICNTLCSEAAHVRCRGVAKSITQGISACPDLFWFSVPPCRLRPLALPITEPLTRPRFLSSPVVSPRR
ncbi:unnamed protein product, partial [Pylaiella littoralis]